MQKSIILSLVLLAVTTTVTTTGCSVPSVYKMNVQQGNIVEKESIDQLQTGMNRRQVHFVLGSPVVESIFDPGYETYIYTVQIAGGKIHRQNITLFYENDILQKMEKRELLSAQQANPAKARTVSKD